MQQQAKKGAGTQQQQGARPQNNQNNYGSNVWDLNELRKGTEAWNKAWTDMLAHNGNTAEWGKTFSQGNKNMSWVTNAWSQFATTCSEATSECAQAFMQKSTEAQSHAGSQATQGAEELNRAMSDANRMLMEGFNCRTLEQATRWTENYGNAAQRTAAENCARAAQASIDAQQRLAQPLLKQALNWQERCWKAWTRFAKSSTDLG